MSGPVRPIPRAEFIALIAALMALNALAIDVMLPALPAMGHALNVAHENERQYVLTAYLVGFGLAQLAFGPISDRFGRKPAIIGAFAIFCAASVFCFFSTSIEMLVAGRILQGLGVSGSSVVTRAMVRDLYEGSRASLQFSTMNMFMGAMPIFAPLMGGVLATYFGWHSVFVFQLAAGVATATMVIFCLSESRPGGTISPREILRGYRIIVTNGAFLANMGIGALAYSGLFAWITGSAFVLQVVVGLSPLEYSFCYATACSGFIVGGWFGTRLVVSHDFNVMAAIGASFCAAAGVLIVTSAVIGFALPITLTLSMAVYFIGLAILLAQSTAAALMPFPQQAGTASSLIGFVQQAAGATMGTLVGATLSKTTAVPMALFIAGAGVSTLVLWALTRRVRAAAV